MGEERRGQETGEERRGEDRGKGGEERTRRTEEKRG